MQSSPSLYLTQATACQTTATPSPKWGAGASPPWPEELGLRIHRTNMGTVFTCDGFCNCSLKPL